MTVTLAEVHAPLAGAHAPLAGAHAPLALHAPRAAATAGRGADTTAGRGADTTAAPGGDPWLTATVRPAGSFGRADAGRLRALLDALSACASVVVLDLRSARLRSPRAATVVDEAATALERRGGCLLCVHADPETRERLAGAAPHAVILDGEPGDVDAAGGREDHRRG